MLELRILGFCNKPGAPEHIVDHILLLMFLIPLKKLPRIGRINIRTRVHLGKLSIIKIVLMSS